MQRLEFHSSELWSSSLRNKRLNPWVILPALWLALLRGSDFSGNTPLRCALPWKTWTVSHCSLATASLLLLVLLLLLFWFVSVFPRCASNLACSWGWSSAPPASQMQASQACAAATPRWCWRSGSDFVHSKQVLHQLGYIPPSSNTSSLGGSVSSEHSMLSHIKGLGGTVWSEVRSL